MCSRLNRDWEIQHSEELTWSCASLTHLLIATYAFMPLTRLWGSRRGRLEQRGNRSRKRGARGMACGVLAARAKGISRTCFTAAACRKLALTWSSLRHTTGRGKACETPRPWPRACRRPGPWASSLSQPCQLLTSSRVRWKVQGRRFVIFHLLVGYIFRKRKVKDT